MTGSSNPFDSVPWIRETHRICAVLESVAMRFPPDSQESHAIAEAALALQYVRRYRAQAESFERLKSRMGGDIDQETRRRMEAIGIDLTLFESSESDEESDD